MTFEDLYERWLRIRFFLYRFFLGRLLVYLLRNWLFGAVALTFYILYRNGVLPLFPVWISLGAWLAAALLSMLFVRLMFRLGRYADGDKPVTVNKNPYSAVNKDRFPNK